MSFQTPLTIRQALDRIETRTHVLPSIQREFVWRPAQVVDLLDSLMRGYPIGSFLFWRVRPENSRDFRFYDFVRNYHERDDPHCPPHDLTSPRELTAVLDGQQRLTSCNIAFRGSMATREKGRWRDNPDAYPRKVLHLNLARRAEENEQGRLYDLRFMRPEETAGDREGERWFPLPDVLGLTNAGPAINKHLRDRGLADSEFAFDALYTLHNLVHERPTISYYLEEEQDLDRVLNIFIRVNSGATKLSYSDLLMSIAAAQWSDDDAREMVHGLVDELNAVGRGFDFGKDFVLKAGLMLSDIASVGFKVTNFNAANMERLRREWPGVRRALLAAARLAAGGGLDGRSLTADSALLPVAYHLHRRGAGEAAGLGEAFFAADKHRAEREAIESWLVRSLLKSGVWGSGLDVTLTALREVLREAGGGGFPAAELEREMARRGRSLRFGPEEVEELLDVGYGDKRVVLLLSLLFPHVDLRHHFHVDHVFPRSLLTRRRLAKAAIAPDAAAECEARRDKLPNLQLLDGPRNEEKSNRLPGEWLAAQERDAAGERHYRDQHLLGELPAAASQFGDFFDARRDRLRQRLTELLSGDVVGG